MLTRTHMRTNPYLIMSFVVVATAACGTGIPEETSAAGQQSISWTCTGDYPPHDGLDDRYAALDDLREQELRAALAGVVKANHHSLGYSGAKRALFGTTGIDVQNGQVECVYTGTLFSARLLDKAGGYNVEHSWPQSEFGAEASTAKADMHHLFAGQPTMNSCRGNFPYGETVQPEPKCSAGGSSRGPLARGTSRVFDVRPERRGDIARAHFYFAVRYGRSIPDAEEAALRCWHEQDPPDDEEMARNDAIEAQQHNRNPFIDRPEFVGYISNF
jgi:deoxyribonuclease-1